MTTPAAVIPGPHAPDANNPGLSARLNWLRAAVLGANDGILSTAGLLIGVAGATRDATTLLVTGLAGLAAGALSMGGGEYVSVSSQRDTELATLDKERWELETYPAEELDELADIYAAKGLSTQLAREVAEQLTAHDALAAHAEAELGIDPEEHSNPWQAALSSMVSFSVGALVPIIFILLSPATLRITMTVVAVAVALLATGFVQTRLGGGRPLRPMLRNLAVGLLAMAITYAIGRLVGGRVA